MRPLISELKYAISKKRNRPRVQKGECAAYFDSDSTPLPQLCLSRRHPFKGHCQGKKLSCGEKRIRFSPSLFAICISTIAAISLNSVSVYLLHQPPIWIKIIDVAAFVILSRIGTRKSSAPCRVQLFFHLVWLLTSVIIAHGTGSKNADNDINGRDGLPITYLVLPPSSWVHRPSHPSSKTFLRHERYSVPHDIVSCSR